MRVELADAVEELRVRGRVRARRLANRRLSRSTQPPCSCVSEPTSGWRHIWYYLCVVKTTVYLPEALKRRLKRVAEQEGRSEAEIIRLAVEEFTATRARPRPKLPLFRSAEPVTDFDEALRGFGQD
jgi:hypothetical protein